MKKIIKIIALMFVGFSLNAQILNSIIDVGKGTGTASFQDGNSKFILQGSNNGFKLIGNSKWSFDSAGILKSEKYNGISVAYDNLINIDHSFLNYSSDRFNPSDTAFLIANSAEFGKVYLEFSKYRDSDSRDRLRISSVQAVPEIESGLIISLFALSSIAVRRKRL